MRTRRLGRALAWMVVCAPQIAACAGPPPAPTLAPRELSAAGQSACATSASNVCARVQACSPEALRFIYGSTADCQAQVAEECQVRYSGPDAADPPAVCDLTATPCSAITNAVGVLLAFDLYAFCPVTPGQTQTGEGCLVDADCASTSCSQTGDGCGTCAPLAPVQGGSSQPLVLGAAGANCTSTEACNLGLGLVCAEAGTCQPLAFVPVGSACELDVQSAVEPIGNSLGAGGFDIGKRICDAAGQCENGTCQPAPSEGDPCVAGVCGPSFTLSCVNGVCLAAASVGACTVASP
jgi:hypothetical protein